VGQEEEIGLAIERNPKTVVMIIAIAAKLTTSGIG